MRTMIRTIAVTALTLLGIQAGLAQITINATDMANHYQVGTQISYTLDTLALSLNIGAPGASAWDFSAIQVTPYTGYSIAKASSTYGSDFPSATVVLRSDSAQYFYSGSLLHGKIELFWDISSGLFSYGLEGVATTGIPGLQVKQSVTPRDTMFRFPLTLGSKWGSSYTQTVILNNILQVSTSSPVNSWTVDAYGKLTLPVGGAHDALRIRRSDVGGTQTYGYAFITSTGAIFTIDLVDHNAPTSGGVDVKAGSMLIVPQGTTEAVGEQPTTIPQSFGLSQNYPNPFNPTTNFNVSVAKTGMVRISVYNILGQEVAVLANEVMAAGTHTMRFDANNLPSGVYFYRMATAGFAATKAMTLVR